MTDRERWTVYPLLFLALGVAMRDKLFDVVNVDNVQCKSLLCNALVVTNKKGQQQVVVTSNEAGGILQTAGNAGRPGVIVGHTKQLSGLLFVDAQGKLLPGTTAAPQVVRPKPQPDVPPDDASPPGEP